MHTVLRGSSQNFTVSRNKLSPSIMAQSPLNNLDGVATVAAGIFAGTAFWTSTGEVPAMQELGLDEHWRFFPLMYKRAFIAQGAATAIAGAGAIIHGFRISNSQFDKNLWLGAGAAFLAMWPYTLGVMVPTNNQIINDNKLLREGGFGTIDIDKRKQMLEKWSTMHMVRTVTSCAAFGFMVYGLTRHALLAFK